MKNIVNSRSTNKRVKSRGRSSPIKVSAHTEFTDHTGILELFGLRRTTVYHLCESEPMLKGAAISIKGTRKDGTPELRGKRMFHVPSFRKFFESKREAAINAQ